MKSAASIISLFIVVLYFLFMGFSVSSDAGITLGSLANLVLLYLLLLVIPALLLALWRTRSTVFDHVLFPPGARALAGYASYFALLSFVVMALFMLRIWDDGLDVHLQIVGSSLFFMLGTAFHAWAMLAFAGLLAIRFKPRRAGYSLNTMVLAFLISGVISYDMTIGKGFLSFLLFAVAEKGNLFWTATVRILGSTAQFMAGG